MRFFDEYAAAIDSGDIPASRLLKLAVERVRRYQNEYEFVQAEADRRIKFIEDNCANTKGSNELLRLALPQKAWLETAWGFYVDRVVTRTDPVTLAEEKVAERGRLIHEVPLIVSRASGKSTLGAAVGLVGQMIDGEYGADVILLGYDTDQAKILFNTAKAMTDKAGTVFEALKENKLYDSTKIGLMYRPTNSVMRIKASDPKRLDGLNNHYNVFDECVDGYNQVLTDGGWKIIKDVTTSDRVAQWDDGVVSFVNPSRTNKTFFTDGFEVDYGYGDTVVQSAGHRNLVVSKHDGKHKDKFPGELSNSYYYVTEGAKEDEGGGLTDMERMWVMTQADGSIVKRARTVAQKEFTDVFNLDDFDYSKADAFIDYVLLWDAWEDKKHDDKYYCSTSKANIDFVQSVAVLAGYATTIYHSVDERKKTYKDYYRLKLVKGRNRCAKAKPVAVNDYLYCLTVPSGYFVMRTVKGSTVVTGNCHTYETDFIKITNDGSSKKRKDWQSWYISTNGTVRDAVFDKYFKTWVTYLEDYTHHDVAPFIYQLDSPDEVKDEAAWRKAIPMLGVTTTKETIRGEIEKASGDMVAQSEIMTKTFNLPVNNYLSFFTNDDCKGNREFYDEGVFTGTREKKARVTVGVDLSDVEDLASVSFMTVREGLYYFRSRKYLPRSHALKLPAATRDKYLQWEHDGHLILHELDYNERDYIFEDMVSFMRDNLMLPVKFGLDPWGAKELETKIGAFYGRNTVDWVRQTTKTLSPAMKTYKALLSAGRVVFDDPVASWCHANVAVKVDANNNIFPNRSHKKGKIDVFASQLDAFIVYEENREKLAQYMV